MNAASSERKLSRRQFLAGATLLAFPTLIPARALGLGGNTAPSNRIAVGIIGGGNMGFSNTESFLNQKDCQVVAVCDVDRKHLSRVADKINKEYQNQDCQTYHDFRELLARRDIDAVMIATPDHWHELVAVEAARQKKDIYGEKPLAHTVAEQQSIVKAVRKHQRIWQTGSWQRSVPLFRKTCEIVRNGLIGEVTHVDVGLPGGHNNSGKEARQMTPSDPPPELDYDFWIGPSQMMPYIQGRTHRNWRWNYNTGGGQLMDWIGHHCDIAHWGCDFDHDGPSEIEGQGEFPPKDDVWNTCTKYRIELKYPRNITMTIAGGYADIREGTKFTGTKGWVYVNRGTFESSNEDWGEWREVPDEVRKVRLYKSTNHVGNFLDCIKSRQPTITPADTAHHSALPGHLGLIAMLVGRKIRWDVASEKILHDAEASRLLTRQFRPPWKLA